MTAEEVDAYFVRLDKPSIDKDGNPITSPPRPLLDMRNLALFHLMEQYKTYPGIHVFAQPVEHWPRARQEDFTTLMLAKGKVQAAKAALDQARATMNALLRKD